MSALSSQSEGVDFRVTAHRFAFYIGFMVGWSFALAVVLVAG